MAEVVTAKEQLIRRMPEILANKIAAGEVVQRPSSVVKELVENSIDAGSSRIDVVIRAAGSDLIQVTDDGCGMSRADAVACLERHATSKIASIEDLDSIRTLGFRGEALASIAAVSRVTLKTGRKSDSQGTLIRVNGGHRDEPEPCAVEQGTSISVKSLFFNVPARRNFLKTDATEYRHIVDTFLSLALSNPSIGFSLTHNDASIFRLSPAPNEEFMPALSNRAGEIYDRSFVDDLVPLEENTGYLSIRGFVALPERHKRSRGDQYLFVNGRSVKSRYLEHAIRSAYDDYLPEGAFPIYTVFLSMDPSHVDVNVHPTKAEVKFDDERGIYAMLRAVTARTLATAFSVPDMISGDADRNSDMPPGIDIPGFTSSGRYSSPDYRPGAVERALLSENLYARHPGESKSELPDHVTTLDRSESSGNLLYQLASRYIVVSMKSGLMLVDQEKAHERVIYERALANLNGAVAMTQQLLFPVTVELAPGRFERASELLEELRLLGFDIEKFGGSSFVVRGVPSDVREGDIKGILQEIAEDQPAKQQSSRRETLAKSLAKRTSVKHGTRLGDHEMKVLIDQLFVCEAPYVCPSGKPVVVWVSTDEIERRFENMSRSS